MKKISGKVFLKICVVLLIIAGGLAYLFSPKPVLKDPEDKIIIMFLVRTTEDGPHAPYKPVENFDEQAILNVLHEAKQRQTFYNYGAALRDGVEEDLILSVSGGCHAYLGEKSFAYDSDGEFKRWVLDGEQVIRDIIPLIDPEELKGTTLEQKYPEELRDTPLEHK